MQSEIARPPVKRLRGFALRAALCAAHPRPRPFGAGARRPKSLPAILCAIGIGASAVAGATSDTGATVQQSLDDAWWTGPILAASPGTLPRGHWLVEPYVYNVMTYGHFDQNGTLRSAGAAHEVGSQTYIEYGLVNGFTLGLIPRLGLSESSSGQDSSGFTVGDITLQGAYGLTQFQPGGHIPTTSLVIGETFPTGKYDRLDGRTDGALGSGAYSTTVSLYSQTYFWMPNGRILRTRLDMSYEISQWASVRGESVYGTSAGFSGHAHPGRSFFADLALEYSATQNWVLATDFWWEHDGNTRLEGGYVPAIAAAAPSYLVQDSGFGQVLYLAPGIEYNWSATMGVIAGARVAALGRNTSATVTPVAAINMVF